MEPARARPVPFWRHGLRPPPEMKPLVLVAAVPRRRFASCILTASWSNELSPSRPNTTPETSKSPTRSRPAENSGTLTGLFCAAASAMSRHRLRPRSRARGMTYHDQRAIRPGHRARNQHRVVVGKDLDDLKIQHRGLFIAQLARHP